MKMLIKKFQKMQKKKKYFINVLSKNIYDHIGYKVIFIEVDKEIDSNENDIYVKFINEIENKLDDKKAIEFELIYSNYKKKQLLNFNI